VAGRLSICLSSIFQAADPTHHDDDAAAMHRVLSWPPNALGGTTHLDQAITQIDRTDIPPDQFDAAGPYNNYRFRRWGKAIQFIGDQHRPVNEYEQLSISRDMRTRTHR
jgi:hypothetical protein